MKLLAVSLSPPLALSRCSNNSSPAILPPGSLLPLALRDRRRLPDSDSSEALDHHDRPFLSPLFSFSSSSSSSSTLSLSLSLSITPCFFSSCLFLSCLFGSLSSLLCTLLCFGTFHPAVSLPMKYDIPTLLALSRNACVDSEKFSAQAASST